MPGERRPTKDELAAAAGRTVPDLLGSDVRILFCGINPGLWSAAVGHHFARPGNRFWKALHGSGFTERLLSPFEEAELASYGLGITNLVARATAQAAELSSEELRAGARRLTAKVGRHGVSWVAFVGLGAYRTAFRRPGAAPGALEEGVGEARAWLLPNPSGLQARYQLPELTAAFAELRKAAEPLPFS